MGAQNEASVVGLADGGFLVTWENDPAGIVRYGLKSDLVLAQRFDAVGNKIGDEFTVKNGTALDSPDVGLLSDGRIAFVVGDVDFVGGDVSTGDGGAVMTSIWDPRDVLIQSTDPRDVIQSTDLIQSTDASGLLDGTRLINGNPGADWHLFA